MHPQVHEYVRCSVKNVSAGSNSYFISVFSTECFLYSLVFNVLGSVLFTSPVSSVRGWDILTKDSFWVAWQFQLTNTLLQHHPNDVTLMQGVTRNAGYSSSPVSSYVDTVGCVTPPPWRLEILLVMQKILACCWMPRGSGSSLVCVPILKTYSRGNRCCSAQAANSHCGCVYYALSTVPTESSRRRSQSEMRQKVTVWGLHLSWRWPVFI